jgi:HlyD family secretion protein
MSEQEIVLRDVTLPQTAVTEISSDAEAVDSPRSDLRLGLIVAGLFFVVFLGWAAFTPLDAASAARGQLIVSGQRQTVQHRDGGVIAEIHVKEGQHVTKGQVLIRLAGAEVQAQERSLAIQMVNLQAQKARLEAEQLGMAVISWPAEFADPNNPLSPIIKSAMQVQTREFQAGRSLLSTQSQVLGQQSAQSMESATGYRSQMLSSAEQERLIDEELESLRTVAEKGYVSKSRLRALERAKADLEGRRGSYAASESEARVAAGANRLRQLEAEKSYRERASGGLREVEAALSEIAPKYRSAHEQLERLAIRAPVTGVVVALNVFTVGGVIAPGNPLMDVVPDQADLVVAAKFPVEDADDLNIGQSAQLKFSGLHDRNLPILNGTLTRLSADSLVDEKTDIPYYTAELRVTPRDLQVIRQVRGADFELRPGMPVDVIVPIRKRTALQYALEPLWDTMWLSFREH